MIIASIRPSTVDGIRQLAKKIRRERSITHNEALEDASRQAGYENFVHAKRQLGGAGAPRGFPVYLSVHWRAPRERNSEPRPDGPRAGREILRVDLARPLSEIVAKHRVSRGRGLHGFRMEYEDHLEHLTNVQGQDEARKVLLTAARSLRFMEATGLQPVSTQRYHDLLRTLEKMPGRDHESQWFDPATEGYLLLDEPYADKLKHHSAERQRWLERHRLQTVSPEWEGIYYPGECLPRLVGPDGALLQRVAGALAKVQPVTEPETWPHETGVCGDDFVSPKRQADAKPRRPRPGPSWREHKGATPYGGAAGIPSRWRPTKPMPFDLHQQLAPLMRKLCVGFSWRVSQKLGIARSQLEDWSIMEHKHQHEDAVYDLYYGGPSKPVCNTDAERLEVLTTARAIVERGYDDCKPRRDLLAALNGAIDEMGKYQNA
ncbi:DUF5623 domain-containing protein [Rhodanobacter denitrificans]|uniref:DUF5623 domain-containing protein n=1 Tax=Rhodanobacter denitrificans TaxID=666685 RepID=UPI000260FF48|nr:DUF5623 domain-containing protein [Rhodanobacter denitrificans]EIM00376.1 hypothetical protein UUC_14160 [Rhodanobacter denitrificans]UJM89220.1 DUF5623 domain-containing protein [Rhodanobacter denitrificans]